MLPWHRPNELRAISVTGAVRAGGAETAIRAGESIETEGNRFGIVTCPLVVDFGMVRHRIPRSAIGNHGGEPTFVPGSAARDLAFPRELAAMTSVVGNLMSGASACS